MINKTIPLCLIMLLCGTLVFASQGTQNAKECNRGEVNSDETHAVPAKKEKISLGALSFSSFLLAPTLTTSRMLQQQVTSVKKSVPAKSE